MDGHIRIQMQKRHILLFLRHAALANTVVSEKHKPDANERCFYCLASWERCFRDSFKAQIKMTVAKRPINNKK